MKRVAIYSIKTKKISRIVYGWPNSNEIDDTEDCMLLTEWNKKYKLK